MLINEKKLFSVYSVKKKASKCKIQNKADVRFNGDVTVDCILYQQIVAKNVLFFK